MDKSLLIINNIKYFIYDIHLSKYNLSRLDEVLDEVLDEIQTEDEEFKIIFKGNISEITEEDKHILKLIDSEHEDLLIFKSNLSRPNESNFYKAIAIIDNLFERIIFPDCSVRWSDRLIDVHYNNTSYAYNIIYMTFDI